MKTKLSKDKMQQFLDSASSKELVLLLWWRFFHRRKIEKFYKNIQDGMSSRFAFENTKKRKK